MIKRAVLWLDDRLGTASFTRRTLRKAFPDHWSFLLGEVALYTFVLLVATGVFLTFFFDASTREVIYDGPYEALQGEEMSAAFRSVLRLSFEVRAGLVMRQIHHWAALVFVGAIVLHVIRVFFTGAFRRPREINWIIGGSLLLLAIGAGFTGYSLPDDLLSGTGLRIAYSVLLSVPFLGKWLAFLLAGGEFPTLEMIGRLFVLHIMVIPALIGAALAAHMAILWRQKHTQFPGPGRTERNVVGVPLWPVFALKSTGLALSVFAVLAALGGLFQINPVWLYGPYDPSQVASPAQPDWYIGWLEGALRLAPPWDLHLFGTTIPETFIPGVVFPGVFFTIFFAWPFIERRISKDDRAHQLLERPRDNAARTGFGAAVLAFAMIITLAGSNDVLARFLDLQVETVTRVLRVAVIVVPPIVGGIAFVVARDLARRDTRPFAPPRAVELRRSASGGFEGSHR